MSFRFQELGLPGLLIIESEPRSDRRGSFKELFKESEFLRAGLEERLVQCNLSRSRRNVLRGLHFQREPHAQGKLVQVLCGRAWSAAVDLRPGSPGFGLWAGRELSEENGRALWIPPGFAHGFLSLSEDCALHYCCTAEYHPECEESVRWDDPVLGIAWPLESEAPILSDRDASAPAFDPERSYFP